MLTFPDSGNSALNFAVLRGHSKIVNRLLRNEELYSAETKEKIMRKALIDASKLGFVDIVKRLLAILDIDVNGSDSSQRTPLMHASENGHDDVRYPHLPSQVPLTHLSIQTSSGCAVVIGEER